MERRGEVGFGGAFFAVRGFKEERVMSECVSCWILTFVLLISVGISFSCFVLAFLLRLRLPLWIFFFFFGDMTVQMPPILPSPPRLTLSSSLTYSSPFPSSSLQPHPLKPYKPKSKSKPPTAFLPPSLAFYLLPLSSHAHLPTHHPSNTCTEAAVSTSLMGWGWS